MSNGNFKVKCIDAPFKSYFTLGKIYEVKNGELVWYSGNTSHEISTIEELNSRFRTQFELVEEKPSTEVIQIFRRKNRVVATITKNDQKFTQSVPLSKANGDFMTAVSMVIELLKRKWIPLGGKETEKVVDSGGNFKARCIYADDDGLTAGKVYEFINGFSKWDDGEKFPQFESNGISRFDSFSDLLKWFSDDEMYKWEEVTEPTTTTPSFDWSSFKSGKFAVHCDTEEKAREFLKECDVVGIRWFNCKASSETNWNYYDKKTIYTFSYGTLGYCDIGGLADNIHHYTIIPYTPLKPAVKEVSRKAEVGEWVKIVKCECTTSAKVKYQDGDILKIIGVDNLGARYGNGSCEWLYPREYVALENYIPEEKPSKEEPKVDTTPKPFVKAKVGDKIKVVKVKPSGHVGSCSVGDIQEVTHVDKDGVGVSIGNYYWDSDSGYIIIGEANPNIEVGDEVEVVDSDYCYTTYSDWFKENEPEIGLRYAFSQITPRKKGYKIIAKHPHSKNSSRMLYAIRQDDWSPVYLVGEKGIKKTV